MPTWARLDYYNCHWDGNNIVVEVEGFTDPDLVDILSDIERCEGRIHLDGAKYIYLHDYRLYSDNGLTFMDLSVKKV